MSTSESTTGDLGDRSVIEIPRSFVCTGLFVVFFMAFIFVPYWELASEPWQQISLAASTMALGILWPVWSSGSVRLRIARKNLLWLLVVGVALVVISRRALTADIPWRGDEDYHTLRTFECASYIVGHWTPCLALAGVMVFLFFASRAARVTPWMIVAACLLCAGMIAGVGIEAVRPWTFVRYPYFSKILSAAPVILAQPFWGDRPPEWVLRVVPFAAAAGVAWLPMTMLRESPRWARVGLALVIGTLPLILYYSSLLYLEMPAVLLMTIVCFRAETLLKTPAERLPEELSWYALLLIGFIKETVAPFILVFLVVRYAIQFARIRKTEDKARAIWSEAKVGICVLLPLAVYLVYRTFFSHAREFAPDAANLIDWRLYAVLARAYAQQFGPALLLAAAGLVLLVAKRQWSVLVFFVAAIAADNALHVIDYAGYVGYSRFSLFTAPMLLVSASLALGWTATKSRWVTALALIGLLAGNAWLFPLEPDGSRKPGWGDSEPYHSVTEWTYPFREACRYISARHPGEGMAFMFEEHSFWLAYYVNSRTQFEVVVGREGWAKFFGTPADRRARVVLYHLRRGTIAEELAEHGYMVEKVFENDAGNKLVVLTCEPRSSNMLE